MRLQLINTIEVWPSDYANSAYESPNGSSKNFPEEWDKYWKKSLADKNMGNLKGIKKGSHLVDINSIKKSELKEILKNELEEVELKNYEEQIIAISGGIVIKANNEFLIEPTCCGDIGQITEWEGVFKESNRDWKQLWIGHPWIFYRIENNIIEFSDYYDTNIEEIKSVESILKIPANELKNKLQIIKKEQFEFEKRIQIALKEMGMENSIQIAKLMTGSKN